MGISGCTACQVGGLEALKAYERTVEQRLKETRQTAGQPPVEQTRSIYENQPLAGATVGSVINVSA